MTHVEFYLKSAQDASAADLLTVDQELILKKIELLSKKQLRSLKSYYFNNLYDMHKLWLRHIG